MEELLVSQEDLHSIELVLILNRFVSTLSWMETLAVDGVGCATWCPGYFTPWKETLYSCTAGLVVPMASHTAAS